MKLKDFRGFVSVQHFRCRHLELSVPANPSKIMQLSFASFDTHFLFVVSLSLIKAKIIALLLALFECPPLEREDQCGSDIKDGNIYPVRRLPEYSVVAVKQHRDQCQPQQDLLQFNAPIVPLRLEKWPLNAPILRPIFFVKLAKQKA